MLQPVLMVALLAASPADASADARQFSACRTASWPKGRCIWRRATFYAVNGWYSSRLSFAGGKLSGVAVVSGPDVNPVELTAARGAIRRYESIHPRMKPVPVLAWMVDGNYLVCPLRQPANDWVLRDRHMTIACIAGVRKLVAHIDRDLL